ncbi:MAG: glycosyltransferase [Chitinophagaceae bacterium]|nr:glycosyltransferase [Chitinophagaceae bacterium]
MESYNVFFSIVIPTYKRKRELTNCLLILRDQLKELNNIDVEIIVSDDAFEEPICIDGLPLNFVAGHKVGPAANRNNGAKYARGKWLIFLDDDCVPDSNFLVEYWSAIKNNMHVKVFEGAVFPIGKKTSMNQDAPLNLVGGKLWSCNFCILRTFFIAIGGFDENFKYPAMEDVEFAYRLKKSGTKFCFVEKAKVYHPWKYGLYNADYVRKHFHSTMYFVHKYPELRSSYNRLYYVRILFHNLVSTIKGLYYYKGRGFFKKLEYDIEHIKIVFTNKFKSD